MYDVAIIGAGIIGTAIAYTLAKYEIKVVVIEKEDDVAKGTTRANSAIIHAGYDPKPGTLMAKTNVRGSILWEELAASLGFEYKKVGSLVVSRTEEENKIIEKLYDDGIANGVKDLHILRNKEILEVEPNLKSDVCLALYAKTAAIVLPYQSCIAFSEFAIRNGVDFFLNSPVDGIERTEEGYSITAGDHIVETKYIVNAAGLAAEDIHMLAGGESFGSRAVKGEYYLLDRKHSSFVNTVVFQVPTSSGKGVLVSPTVHGNILVGPTSMAEDDRDSTTVTAHGLDAVREQASYLFDNIPFYDNIRNFAGNRAYIDLDDFLVKESDTLPNFINLAGIKSPGLSSAPALAEEVIGILENLGLELHEKEVINKYTYPINFSDLPEDKQEELLKENPSYGRVICRCETVTEGDIINALSSPLTPPTISAVKRRVNVGMGRCQGGFCSVRVHEIIANQRNIPLEDVTLDGNDSYIVYGDTKKGVPEL